MELLGDKMALDYNHDPLTPEGSETADFPEGKTLVMGHFRAQRYASADAYWATFLRHPVDFLISLYFFWKKFPESHGLHARFLREQPTIFELAKYPGITNLMSEGYFGGFDMDRFNFIGFHKDRNTDLSRLARDIDLPLSAAVCENRTYQCAERLDFEADVSIQRKLTDLLADDVAFYEQQYERRAAGSSPAEYDHCAEIHLPHSENVGIRI